MEKIEKNTKTAKWLINFRRIKSCYWYSFLELFAVKNKFFNNLLINWRKPVFIDEIKMINIKENDNVLLIGCGIFPTETILISEETKANVTGIDNSKRAVKIASKYLKKNKFPSNIEIKYGDGTTYPVDNFNKIFIAINVWPIDSVLKNLSKNMKKNSVVLCRGMKNDVEDILKNEDMLKTYKIHSAVKRRKTESYLLIKK